MPTPRNFDAHLRHFVVRSPSLRRLIPVTLLLGLYLHDRTVKSSVIQGCKEDEGMKVKIFGRLMMLDRLWVS